MEDIKFLVQEEGRAARNLVAFNVPVIQLQCDTNINKVMKKPPTSPRLQSENRRDEPQKLVKRSREPSQAGSRVRSASTGRDKKSELHARYWAFLFGNLQRAVDEIYQTCESDESVTECKEVIMVLDNYTREFKNLINWFKLKWDYETTPPPQRPHSLAWEIRKNSPGKIKHKSINLVFKDLIPSDMCPDGSSFPKYFDKNRNSTLKNIQETLNVVEEDQNSISHLCTEVKKEVDLAVNKKEKDSNMQDSIKLNILNKIDLSNNAIAESLPKQDKNDLLHINDTVICKSKSLHLMTDGMSQTDSEKNLDENEPKYRSKSQQTCSILTGYSANDSNIKEKKDLGNTLSEVKKQTCSPNNTNNIISKALVKSRTSDEGVPQKEDVKSLSKTGTNASKSLSVTNATAIVSKPTVRSLYSQATTKSMNSAKISVRTAQNSNVSKPINSRVQLQPWSTKRPAAPVTKSPLLSKLTRSKTVIEVSRSDRGTLASRTARPMKCVKKDTVNGKEITPNNPEINKLNNNDNIKSSTSMCSSVSSSVIYQDSSGSVEVLTSQNGNEEDDGWVKVRSRSRFSPATKTGDLETTLSQSASNLKARNGVVAHHGVISKNRFYQPSSAISLPSLAFNSSDHKESSGTKKTAKAKTDLKNKPKENGKNVKKPEKGKVDEFSKKKASNNEKARKYSIRFQGEKRSTNKTIEVGAHGGTENEKRLSLDRSKVNGINDCIVTDQESLDEEENNFDEEIKKNKETEEMLQKEINELEATDIELETGDEETDGENTTGTEEEPDLEKKTNLSLDALQDRRPSPKKLSRYNEILNGMTWAEHMETLDELEKLVVQDCSNEGMTKDEQMDTLERLEEFVARHPGRALELHQKLSSPSRRRTMLETVKKFQARQAKASEKREQLKMEKAQRLRELLKKVDEVKAAKDKLIEDRRQRLEMKLKRAAENRSLHLKEIMRKAHDEEEKLKEIAFINTLEAQNKRHDFMTQCQEQEGRLQGIHEERQRKQEEKAAKEAAVEERRRAIEAERQEKLEKMQERQRKRDEQADKKKQEKEKERQELAREKARDRTERLEALHAAQLEAQEELQKKIQQKQEDYARRHEENIEQIRQKALELSISKCSDDVAPRMVPYETQKLCTACNVLIGSEVYLLSHLRGKKHLESVKNLCNGKDLTKEEIERYNIKSIVNAPSDKIDPKTALDKERIKNFKKKCKKIRVRMVSKGEEYISKLTTSEKLESPGKNRLQKCLRDIEKIISNQGKGQWSDNAITTLERSMGEISRTLNAKDPRDQLVFRSLNGFSTLNNVLQLDMDVPQHMTPYLPQKCFVTASTTYLAAINKSSVNCKYVILSNKIISLLDILLKRLTNLLPDHVSGVVVNNSKLPVDSVASVIMRVIAEILMDWEEKDSRCGENQINSLSDDFLLRLQDIISYAVSVGIVDKLTRYCKAVRDPLDEDLSAAQFLLSILELLTTLTVRCKTVRHGNEDPTQLLATLEITELVGAVSILYGTLLHQGSPPRLIDALPPTLPSHTVAVAVATIKLLRSVAELDLQMFQNVLGAEGISLQFRHIASYLLWFCCHDKEKTLLHEVVAVVGYFAVKHRDNQMILQSGSTPTVLQQLCNLPFPYFSNPELSALLFPTLLACCFDNEENKKILEQEISYSLLEDFIRSDVAANHPLIVLISARTK